jgi:hypothetical protein
MRHKRVDSLKKLLTKFAMLALNKTSPLLKIHLIIAESAKNLLWGGSNIQKRQLCVKGILAGDLGFVAGLFSGVSGDFRVRGRERALSTIGGGSSAGFEAHPWAHRFLLSASAYHKCRLLIIAIFLEFPGT